jgi:hypothetical protein
MVGIRALARPKLGVRAGQRSKNMFGEGGEGMDIPDGCVSRLRSAGLLVEEHFFPAGHIAYPDGCVIGKPKEASGNRIPMMEDHQPRDGSPVIDAPGVKLHAERGK